MRPVECGAEGLGRANLEADEEMHALVLRLLQQREDRTCEDNYALLMNFIKQKKKEEVASPPTLF